MEILLYFCLCVAASVKAALEKTPNKYLAFFSLTNKNLGDLPGIASRNLLKPSIALELLKFVA